MCCSAPTSPFVFGGALRRRALVLLAEIGVPVKYGHSEVGLALAPLPEAALGVVLTQWVLRNLAAREGMQISFDPFLREGHAGSGLHFHFSAVQGGRHTGRSGENGLDPAGRWLVAGLVRFGAALMAFGNRGTASLQRLRQAREAPSRISWGAYDRGALVRLPVVARAPDGRETSPPTIEFRLPDGSAQPYFLLAGVAQAMLAARAAGDVEEVLERAALPRSLPEIADALDAHRSVFEEGGVFPPGMIDQVMRSLRA